jgi:hypothetical protein
MTSETLNQSFDKMAKTALRIKAERDALLAACEAIYKRIEDGDLVRDISRDEKSDWSIRMMGFVQDLNRLRLAIAMAKGEC